MSAVGAVAGTALAVVSGAAGWGTAHRLLAALARDTRTWREGYPAWTSARRLLPAAAAAVVLFGLAALVTAEDLHLGFAAAAFAATALLGLQVFRRAAAGRGLAADYLTLTKPRVMSLLLLTGGAGAFVGHGRTSLPEAATGTAGVGGGSGRAGSPQSGEDQARICCSISSRSRYCG